MKFCSLTFPNLFMAALAVTIVGFSDFRLVDAAYAGSVDKECGIDPKPNIDWSGCKMNWIDLSKADLRGANLAGSSIISGNLSGANLAGANMQGAALAGVNMSSANLTNADLRKATMVKSNMAGAILTGARFGGAIYINAKICKENSIGGCK